jgi:4-amino-4-deoxy-L-arabinose transferase-like glycosyltransferase
VAAPHREATRYTILFALCILCAAGARFGIPLLFTFGDNVPFAMNPRFHFWFLLLLALGIYVGVAGWPAVIDDADGGHAIASREMLERGDWAVMHINGIRWLEKAPLHYWLVAASYRLLGQNAFSTRLPLALGVVGLVLMVYLFGRRWFGERAGFYAGLAMCTSVGTFIFTRAMIPEAIYALEFTAIFYLFLRAWENDICWRRGFWGAASLIGFAVLTRGLIGAIFPLATITLFILAVRGRNSAGRERWREIPFWSSAFFFLLIAVPWHVVVSLRTPGFFEFYFFNEHFLRALGWRYPQDYGSVPLLLWWAEHLVWLFPWSVFMFLAPRPKLSERFSSTSSTSSASFSSNQALLLTYIWAIVILIFFSISKRMEYYSFGAWPALALLCGLGLARAEETQSRWLPRVAAALAVLGLALAGTLVALVWMARGIPVEPDISKLLQLQEESHYRVAMASFSDLTVRAFATLRGPALGAAAAFFVALTVAWFARRRNAQAAAVITALGMAGFIFAANGGFALFEPHLSSRPLAEQLRPHLHPDDQLVIYGEFYGGPSLAFYLHRKALLYNGRYHGLEFGSYFPDAPKIFLTDQDFPAVWRGPRRVFLFAPQHWRREVLLRLPADASYLVAENGGKAIYSNQPLTPDQPTLAQLGIRPPAP